MTRTRYEVKVLCEDIGEYDALFLARIAARVSEELGQAGVIGYDLRVARVRLPGDGGGF